MTQLQAAWLSVVLLPPAVLAVLVATVTRRSATKAGQPVPRWALVLQFTGSVLVMLVGLAHVMSTDQ